MDNAAAMLASVDAELEGMIIGVSPPKTKDQATAPGHGDESTQKKHRSLHAEASIDENDNFFRADEVAKTVLKAEDVKDKALPLLAGEHLLNFRNALGAECERRLAPNCEIRIATACTGSGAEVFTLLAIIEAFRSICPELRFTYVFHCEKASNKRLFVQELHKHLGERLSASTEPCFYDDITKLVGGEANCCTHVTKTGLRAKPMGSKCPVQQFDWLFCSSSCKDLSSENSGRMKGACFKLTGNKNRQKTPGGSAETFWALTDVMKEYRPDIVFFENVEAIDHDKGDGSNLDILKAEWGKEGYECQVMFADTFQFGLPQHRRR